METVETEIYDSYDWKPEIYEEPRNFTGYMDAIADGTYAPGKKMEDYLLSAYELFKEGNHGDDYFSIGSMWFDLYCYPEILGNEPDVTVGECLDNALEYYKKQEEIENILLDIGSTNSKIDSERALVTFAQIQKEVGTL